MDVDALIEQLVADGPGLAGAADRAGWDTPVPGTEWDVRQLVLHVGGIHRWAADIVTRASPSPDTPAGQAVGTGPGEDELLEWFLNGHAALVESLRTAPDDLDCCTFLPADSPRHFWARRQAHETAVHRMDAEAAAGLEPAVLDIAFAQDGIAEMLDGFARRKSNAVARAATIGLDAADGPSWLIRFGGERTEAERSDDLAGTDVAIRGLSSDLYFWLWNRRNEATVEGDPAIAALWAGTVQVRWA